jgi:hypothetical protein
VVISIDLYRLEVFDILNILLRQFTVSSPVYLCRGTYDKRDQTGQHNRLPAKDGKEQIYLNN